MGDKLKPESYVELWKTWNRYVWYTPIAFLTILTVLGTSLKYMLTGNKILPKELGIPTDLCLGIILILVGAALVVCTLVLYRFTLRREAVGHFIETQLEDVEQHDRLFRIWREIGTNWRALDFVSLLIATTGIGLVFAGLVIFFGQLYGICEYIIVGLLVVPVVSIPAGWFLTRCLKHKYHKRLHDLIAPDNSRESDAG